MRDGAASWPSLAAVAVCGGMQECNLAARVGCEAWADSPASGHGLEPRGKTKGYINYMEYASCNP